MNLDGIETIAITDCGSTTTKAILIEKIDGVFRQTARGDAPTTVEAPVEDVTRGVITALDDLSKMRGRRLIDENNELIRPSRDGEGVDLYLSTSSAGGGLQMLVAGMVRRLSAESAERAALGAGAIVTDVVACDDERPAYSQIERMRGLRPDIVLLAGGTDGGADLAVIELAELLLAANPRPRFGDDYRLPVIFAGNQEISDQVEVSLSNNFDVFKVANIRPDVDTEKLTATHEKIHELFLDHVMRQAPGFCNLVKMTDTPVIPTPSAVGEILIAEAEQRNISALSIDIGGATTDIFSVVNGVFSRTVSANLGMSYSSTNVLNECGVDNIMRWLPVAVDSGKLSNQIMNKTIRPTTIPDTLEELLVEQALAREAMRLSFAQHRAFSPGLKGLSTTHNFEGAFGDTTQNDSLSPMDLDLLIASGGVLSHAPRAQQTASMMIDSFLPEGVTRLSKDSIFMMPHLGVLSRSMPEAARAVFDRDCLGDLGTCVAPMGRSQPGQQCLSYTLTTAGGTSSRGTLKTGDCELLALPAGETAELELIPSRNVDVGSGRSKPWCGVVHGGPVGIVLDGRGRPIIWSNDSNERQSQMLRWLTAIGAYSVPGAS
jgi:uncharacterized protein (TIGR01319 family)